MKKTASLVAALGLALSASAFAAPEATQPKDTTAAPVQMSDAELDQVTAGQAAGLIAIDVQNVLNNNNVAVAVPVTVRDVNVGVAAAVAVLGAAGAAVGQP
jgi:hypothetical protein